MSFLASVNHTGRSSMEIGIRVESEDIAGGHRTHTNSCHFTMVVVGEDASVPGDHVDRTLRLGNMPHITH